ncbi:3-galactosyl-N-acetylglucosaminide 4-alpha-L-fucosyltransferase FUT3-like [Rana temporaria]|uniref:3-galactosyl-N-acetylglucosaminide 4-alpha-L-fucosyltransferase FUT3-like n=1 Tax=Rana temporaria TaxID=8407 RepID=UPI001AADEB9E|nr:3-galactosyl-N-acetylglucosaminide 4-alpha-L-fucosyltransferase FUT3-like [Rana temporaria]
MKSAQQPALRCHYFAIFLIQTLVALVLFGYNHISNNRIINKASIATNCTNSPPLSKNVVVLLWTWPFGTQFSLDKCPKPFDSPRCILTANRSLYNTANAVVLHHRDVCGSKDQMPQVPRPEGQYWVWFNLESPSHSPNLHFMDKLINLTMSFRIDSDIFTPYGWLEQNEVAINYTIPEKSKLVAWIVSNWNPHTRRVQLYEDLKNYIPIDIYGRQHISLATEQTVSVVSKYKFYFSFENSIHTDYITEKLWHNAFASGCVPVVLGPPRENYERLIPSDSFIHVDDFPSAKELASYLLELDKNDQKYQEYFKWRSKLSPVTEFSWIVHYCKACVGLHNAPSYRTASSLGKWFT